MIEKTMALIEKYFLVQKKKEELATLKNKVQAETTSFIEESIIQFFRGFSTYIDKYCSRRSEHIKKAENGSLYFDGNCQTEEFDALNYQDKANKCFQVFSTVFQNPTNETAQMMDFCRAYNTLLLMMQYQNELAEDRIAVESEQLAQETKMACLELDNVGDESWQQIETALQNKDDVALKTLLKKEQEKEFCPGNVVYGKQVSNFADDFTSLHISADDCSVPISLKAKDGENSVFMFTQDESVCECTLETFLPALFLSVSSSYAPRDFSLAFIERDALNNTVCARFCNRILNLTESGNDNNFDCCLYQTRSAESWGKATVHGYANTDTTISAMVSSLYQEYTYRKGMPRLKGKTIQQYNIDNPHETLPYHVLIINTFSELFRSSQADELFNQLQSLIVNGGKYGFFVIAIGKNTVVIKSNNYFDESKESKYDLLSIFGDCVLKLDETNNTILPLSNCDAGETLFAKWKEKCQKMNSLSLPDVFGQDTETPPDFYDEKGAISIPLGIANGKVFRFETILSGNHGVSAILTGSIGSGKTTLIRTLIMSGAYCYSPDQLQFYIIDFKSATGSADFDCFAQEKNEAYVPHIRFLSARANVRQIHTLLQFVRSICTERAVLFSKHSYKDAAQYRARLFHEMQEHRCASYADYYNKVGPAESLPALPQIFVIIDEANVIFDDNIDLITELGKIARVIRSYGISIILSGQSNPLFTRKEVLEHFGIRIALTAKEAGIYSRTFSSADDDALDRGFSFLGGKIGKAVIQAGNNHLTFVNTAYLSYERLKEYAKNIRAKYKNDSVYQWMQMRPGSSESVSADVLAGLFNKADSVVYADNYGDNYFPIYIGLNSLSSLPHPLILKSPDDELDKLEEDEETNRQKNNDPHNYCIYAPAEKQIKIIWNVIFYFANYLKKSDKQPVISFNYTHLLEWDRLGNVKSNPAEERFEQYMRIFRDTSIENCLQVQRTDESVTSALIKCYHVYEERRINQKVEHYPYLFCLANADKWLASLDCQNFNDNAGKMENAAISYPTEFIANLKRFVTDPQNAQYDWSLSEDEWEVVSNSLGYNETVEQLIEPLLQEANNMPECQTAKELYAIIQAYNDLLGQDNMASKPSEEASLSSGDALAMVADLLKYGAAQDVYLLFAYSSMTEKMSDSFHFINLNEWKNVVTDAKNDPNVCYCKKAEVRLWDFTGAQKWAELLKEI